MVKVGFIVEGTSDFIILKSDKFQNFLKYNLNTESNESLIKVARGRTRLKTNFVSLINSLRKLEVNYIFTLLDQDDLTEQNKTSRKKLQDCPLAVVNEIINFKDNGNYSYSEICFIVMTREMEAWFLADSNLNLECDGEPDKVISPSDINGKQIRVSNHVTIANRFKDKFTLVSAAKKSKSAKRFLDKLNLISVES